ncbi:MULTISPECIES: lipopolysaccharide assembly protein LapB [unclassified Treponema]|uniref:tetratricopeptide repeat protein n=1 Tax=unclassified Treponema TaxID=2638727 RepID=UPI0020A5BE83|nr:MULTISPECIES: tetratricopeptide repeat protein [unclassified Treponema]UTC65843.1 tetratricopeptide repeat protein [Treponema sp. OMZ 789]UTC68571.1 tetratricopeptide repeat protein [Treponema sp. OMZ 790]UTC71301.1 tetratricopeptide repeat protein [Treponema sp. OMZ 791]
MVKISRIICIGFIVFVISSCTKTDRVKLNFLSGYLAWKQNDWNKAASKFLNSIDLAEEADDKELKNYVDFAVGSIYLMQNEDSSALSRFDAINENKDETLNSYIYYQKGIIEFKNQDYGKAVAFFKKSLELNPNSIDAKINFELSMRYQKKQKDKPANSQGVNISQDEEDKLSEKTILNLIRKKEKERWQDRTQENKQPSAFDY